jgi:predicted membrane-bound dolichyl-phosphate-mannose-protein mannosyltransferase
MNSSYFDEIYHPRTAYENIHRMEPYETTHPPLGKAIMTIGIFLFA